MCHFYKIVAEECGHFVRDTADRCPEASHRGVQCDSDNPKVRRRCGFTNDTVPGKCDRCEENERQARRDTAARRAGEAARERERLAREEQAGSRGQEKKEKERAEELARWEETERLDRQRRTREAKAKEEADVLEAMRASRAAERIAHEAAEAEFERAIRESKEMERIGREKRAAEEERRAMRESKEMERVAQEKRAAEEERRAMRESKEMERIAQEKRAAEEERQAMRESKEMERIAQEKRAAEEEERAMRESLKQAKGDEAERKQKLEEDRLRVLQETRTAAQRKQEFYDQDYEADLVAAKRISQAEIMAQGGFHDAQDEQEGFERAVQASIRSNHEMQSGKKQTVKSEAEHEERSSAAKMWKHQPQHVRGVSTYIPLPSTPSWPSYPSTSTNVAPRSSSVSTSAKPELSTMPMRTNSFPTTPRSPPAPKPKPKGLLVRSPGAPVSSPAVSGSSSTVPPAPPMPNVVAAPIPSVSIPPHTPMPDNRRTSSTPCMPTSNIPSPSPKSTSSIPPTPPLSPGRSESNPPSPGPPSPPGISPRSKVGGVPANLLEGIRGSARLKKVSDTEKNDRSVSTVSGREVPLVETPTSTWQPSSSQSPRPPQSTRSPLSPGSPVLHNDFTTHNQNLESSQAQRPQFSRSPSSQRVRFELPSSPLSPASLRPTPARQTTTQDVPKPLGHGGLRQPSIARGAPIQEVTMDPKLQARLDKQREWEKEQEEK